MKVNTETLMIVFLKKKTFLCARAPTTCSAETCHYLTHFILIGKVSWKTLRRCVTVTERQRERERERETDIKRKRERETEIKRKRDRERKGE
jgi:hypothetical protein